MNSIQRCLTESMFIHLPYVRMTMFSMIKSLLEMLKVCFLYISKMVGFSIDRMLHHTSFLWDYDDDMMSSLKVT